MRGAWTAGRSRRYKLQCPWPQYPAGAVTTQHNPGPKLQELIPSPFRGLEATVKARAGDAAPPRPKMLGRVLPASLSLQSQPHVASLCAALSKPPSLKGPRLGIRARPPLILLIPESRFLFTENELGEHTGRRRASNVFIKGKQTAPRAAGGGERRPLLHCPLGVFHPLKMGGHQRGVRREVAFSYRPCSGTSIRPCPTGALGGEMPL